MNWYVSYDRWCQTAIRGFFGLPCRFPATPSILAVVMTQVYDCTRFFGTGEPRKFFSRVFPARQGTGEALAVAPLPAGRLDPPGEQFVHPVPRSELGLVFRSHRLLQRGGVDRRLAQALASCRKDCVGHCGNDGRSPALTHPARRLGTLDDVDLDGRRLIDAQDLVGIEVGLLNAAVLQRDLAIERCRHAEHDRALDLSPDGIGIDDSATIDRADDAPDTNRAILRHFDFGNLRHIGPEDELDGDAAADPFRQRLSPTDLFRRQLEDGFGAGRLVEKSPPIGDRILLRRRRQFVHEAFGHEDSVRRSDAAPEGSRNAGSTRKYSTRMFGRA